MPCVPGNKNVVMLNPGMQNQNGTAVLKLQYSVLSRLCVSCGKENTVQGKEIQITPLKPASVAALHQILKPFTSKLLQG